MKCLFPLAIGCLCLLGCTGPRGGIAQHSTPYTRPLESPGAKFGGLPPAVQNTIRAQTGGESIFDILKDTSSGVAIYQVHFENRDVQPLFIASDGSVLNPDTTVAVGAAHEQIGALSGGATGGLKLSDLPAAVMKAVQEQAPNTEIAFIEKRSVEGRDRFIISFKDPVRNPSLSIAADGTIAGASRK